MHVRPNRSDHRSRCADRGPADADARTPRARTALRLSWGSCWAARLRSDSSTRRGLLILIDQPAVEVCDASLCSVARPLFWHGEQGGTPEAMGSVEKAV